MQDQEKQPPCRGCRKNRAHPIYNGLCEDCYALGADADVQRRKFPDGVVAKRPKPKQQQERPPRKKWGRFFE